MSPRGWKWTGGIMVALGAVALVASVPLAFYGLALAASLFLLPVGMMMLAAAVGLAVLGVSLLVGGLFAVRHGRRRPKKAKKGAARAAHAAEPPFVRVEA